MNVSSACEIDSERWKFEIKPQSDFFCSRFFDDGFVLLEQFLRHGLIFGMFTLQSAVLSAKGLSVIVMVSYQRFHLSTKL
jgi:hypothetical protein